CARDGSLSDLRRARGGGAQTRPHGGQLRRGANRRRRAGGLPVVWAGGRYRALRPLSAARDLVPSARVARFLAEVEPQALARRIAGRAIPAVDDGDPEASR